eukprot:COSAG01_NODE_5175_length_4432_cov_37.356335_6_plen_254_part_00
MLVADLYPWRLQAAVTRHAMTGTIGDESPILLRLVDLLARGAMLQEWSASLVFNLSSNSASIAARLVAAGAESALSAMVGSSSATNLGRKYASNALPLLEAASSSSAPALGGIEGMSALSQHVQAIVAERDRAVAERDQAVAALRQGGGGTSHAAAATPASVLPALQGTVVVAPYVPEPEPTAPSTPRSVMCVHWPAACEWRGLHARLGAGSLGAGWGVGACAGHGLAGMTRMAWRGFSGGSRRVWAGGKPTQ